jgi:hypothetical protein
VLVGLFLRVLTSKFGILLGFPPSLASSLGLMKIWWISLIFLWQIFSYQGVDHGMRTSFKIFLILPLCKAFSKSTFLVLAMGINGLGSLPLQVPSLLSAREVSLIPSSRSSPLLMATWQVLCGLKLQARLKHLLWKIAWDILPSRANIGRFVVSKVNNAWGCPFCRGPIETLNHIFLDCVGKSSVEFLPLASQNFLFLY